MLVAGKHIQRLINLKIFFVLFPRPAHTLPREWNLQHCGAELFMANSSHMRFVCDRGHFPSNGKNMQPWQVFFSLKSNHRFNVMLKKTVRCDFI